MSVASLIFSIISAVTAVAGGTIGIVSSKRAQRAQNRISDATIKYKDGLARRNRKLDKHYLAMNQKGMEENTRIFDQKMGLAQEKQQKTEDIAAGAAGTSMHERMRNSGAEKLVNMKETTDRLGLM